MNKNVSFTACCVIAGLVFLASGCEGVLKKSGKTEYEFGAVSRGSIEKIVSSSGTLNPVATVSVLSRMNGKVDSINVDYNDRIRKGDVLAALNTDTLKLQREQQRAQVIKARANYELQLLNYQNLEKLAEKNLISDYELRSGRTTLAIQQADLASAEASLKVIETEINQYALILSPIDGIVLERNINEGDTVVENSSSNSSSLFTLAENLEEMRIEARVGELDIPSIFQGQETRFTLEALPGRSFTGTVENRYLMPVTENNMVSYRVIVRVENQDGSLLPGMTCAVNFIESKRENVLLVPNAALRYRPSAMSDEEFGETIFNASLQGMSEEQKTAAITARADASGAQAKSGSSNGLAGLMIPSAIPGGGRGGPRPAQTGAANSGSSQTGRASTRGQAPVKQLWYLGPDGTTEVVLVRTGVSDGINTEVFPISMGRPEFKTAELGKPEMASFSPDGREGAIPAPASGELEGMRIILREKI